MYVRHYYLGSLPKFGLIFVDLAETEIGWEAIATGRMEDDNCGDPFMESRNKYDIVGSLPLELVVQIAEYLDVTEILRLQKVCHDCPYLTMESNYFDIGSPRSPGDGTRFSQATQSPNVSRWMH